MTLPHNPADTAPPLSRTRSRLTLLLIVAMFLGSFGLAAVLFFSGWHPSGKGRNYGELLAPPIDLNTAVLVLEADRRWPWQNSEGEWTALLRLPAECDDACWQRMAMLPRVRASLGRHAPRLHLLVMDRELPIARRADLQPFRTAAFAGPGPLPSLPTSVTGPELWLVDPHGYAVLHYPPGFDPSGLRKDLGKLLK